MKDHDFTKNQKKESTNLKLLWQRNTSFKFVVWINKGNMKYPACLAPHVSPWTAGQACTRPVRSGPKHEQTLAQV